MSDLLKIAQGARCSTRPSYSLTVNARVAPGFYVNTPLSGRRRRSMMMIGLPGTKPSADAVAASHAVETEIEINPSDRPPAPGSTF